MHTSDIQEAILVGIFLAFMIGPVFFMLIKTSILKGFRAAFSFDLGVVLGDIFFILFAYYGSRSLLNRIKDHPYLYIFGGVVMILYGILTFFNKKKEYEAKQKVIAHSQSQYFQLFINGFFLNFINVGVLGFWLGMVMIYGAKYNMNQQRILLFFSIVVLSYLLTDVVKILIAKRLREYMTSSRILKMKKIMGIILIIFGFVLIAKSYFPKNKKPTPQIITNTRFISKEVQ